MSKDDPLGWKEAELLNAIGDGADLFDRAAADIGRGLIKRGLLTVTKPKASTRVKGREGAPPYYGAKPTASGKRLAAEYFDRELGVKRWG